MTIKQDSEDRVLYRSLFEQFTKFRNSISEQKHRLIVDILYETGVKASELVDIQVENLAFKEGKLRIKGKRQREISLSRELSTRLKSFAASKQSYEFLFSTRQSPKFSVRRVEQILALYSEKVGLTETITPRLLRKLFLLRKFREKESFEKISSDLGISNVSKKKIIDRKQAKILLASAESLRDQVILGILLETGCKISELAKLKLSDISISRGEIRFGNLRRLSISKKLTTAIARFSSGKKQYEFLFSTRQSAIVSVRRIQQIIKNAAEKLTGFPEVSAQILRDSMVAHKLGSGISIDEILLETGLSNITFTDYGQVDFAKTGRRRKGKR